MVRADELDREVNRLYWKTDEPVTRLAEQLEVSRGTFYNHLRPLPAGANCSACGARLLFRTRSSRDAGDAHCGECSGEERIGGTGGSTKPAASGAAGRTRSPSPARSAPPTRAVSPGRPAKPSAARAVPPAVRAGQAGSASPAGGLNLADRLRDDEARTQLLIIAVGAAALGLGILYYARHRS